MALRCWEHDDFPCFGADMLRTFDGLHDRWPNFKASIFAIPTQMTDADFDAISARPWLKLYPHGFHHDKAECREPTTWRQCLPILDQIAADPRWGRVFKAPWHGLDPKFVCELHHRGFTVSVKTIPFFPYPMYESVRCVCHHDHWIASGKDDTAFVESHPCYDDPRAFKAADSEISEKHLAIWTKTWEQDDAFVFSEALARPLCLKINLGCGPQIWPGWQCLDDKAPGSIHWDMLTCKLPWGQCKADAIVMSHALAHLPEQDYEKLFAEVFRVLRPGAVFRFLEGDGDSGYVWRMPGESARGNGPIVSVPTKTKVVAAMVSAGLTVFEAKPGVTRSPHTDILQVDGRFRRWEKGQTFAVEAVKACSICDITRASHRRPAKPRDLSHLYLEKQ